MTTEQTNTISATDESAAIADARVTAEANAEELFGENPEHCRAQRWDVADPSGDSGVVADASGVAPEHRAAWVHAYDAHYRATMRRLVSA